MKKNSSKTTIKDIAKEAKVSISTVSRYINQSGYVEVETARRIQKAIDQTYYVPSMAARSLRNQKGAIILLVVPDISNPFYSNIAKTVQHLARERNYIMALYDSQESIQEIPSVRIAQQMYASGILLASIDIKPEMIQALMESNIPVVGLNAYQQYPFDTVHVQGSDGSYLATKHLLSLGHRFIGFAGGTPNTMIGTSRWEGFELAMKEEGATIHQEYVMEMGFSQDDGYQVGQWFLQKKQLPTAIVCANDQIAFGLLAAMYEKGIKVPEDISVTGMDDIPYAKISNPSLTTVTNDSVAFATQGLKMLFERIDGIYTQATPREVAITHQLVVRQSSSIPFKEGKNEVKK